ncbi:helix-turn-helix domain-containing protein [Roseburia intestinalis]|uniref:helix-turn-helix domain-containing protein n=1 Tax=Roseburia intestinalis TaxID=166486 RepID=UPI001AD81A46
MNTTTLKSVFKAVYGMPIASYMKEYRMKLASNMLLQEDKSISEIAAAVGYKSQSKFTSAFRDIYFRYYLLHIRNKYPIQMHLQTLEIIGFKESVKKSNT